ncbi:MAG: hypothetical protein KC620_07125, partial [Myxococcales bacterium]|nr:hypothetical protein [Myxococcales bacterium]
FVMEDWHVPSQWGEAGYTWIADYDQDGKADIGTAIGEHVFIRRSHGDGFGFDARHAQVVDGRFNVAIGRLPRQSSIAPTAIPERALDGDRAGPPMGTRDEVNPWFEIDLGLDVSIFNVLAFAPVGESLGGLVAELSSTPCDAPTVIDAIALPDADSAAIALDGVGRYVCVRRPAGGTVRLTEVEVYQD